MLSDRRQLVLGIQLPRHFQMSLHDRQRLLREGP
jgi:hypothetical protein